MKLWYLYLLFCNISITALHKKPVSTDFSSCKKCIYFRPDLLIGDYNYGKCTRFGTIDMITNKINYEYIDNCRNNENECGKSGNYYEMDKNAEMKLFLYSLLRIIPNVSIIPWIIIIYYSGRNK